MHVATVVGLQQQGVLIEVHVTMMLLLQLTTVHVSSLTHVATVEAMQQQAVLIQSHATMILRQVVMTDHASMVIVSVKLFVLKM
jgi:hypothetical protein